MQKKLVFVATGIAVLVSGAVSAAPQRPKMEPAVMMQQLDMNGNGQISKKEFLQGAARHADQASPQNGKARKRMNPEEMFARMDRNDDGVLTRAELDRMAKERQSRKN
ncbi:EF-hand domain-containing protein [Paracoccus sp. Z330]|uniref:EF-hand domain-containing protein n=1 Tax=Paracoccus onchidii TaxID=3017813 RepID=A0ABT4ZJL5_9RHOB|nr:EF-hand domain-containing protein [Paracoccus onchidii]MDB6179252.1 EF-hand domain-containing protein [Paracoccus onchidii]